MDRSDLDYLWERLAAGDSLPPEVARELREYVTGLEAQVATPREVPTEAKLRAHQTLARAGLAWLRDPSSEHAIALRRAISRVWLFTKEPPYKDHP